MQRKLVTRTRSSRRPSLEQLETRQLLTAQPPKFITPIAGVPYQDWTIVNYVDDDPIGITDYHGGGYTYEGHNGIDYMLTDFARMDEGVPIFAAADGVVSDVHDGEYDRHSSSPNVEGNEVWIDHGGGYMTYYTHMREGSVAVQVGQSVSVGTILGMAGSSGRSAGPHLHFSVFKDYQTVDPYLDPSTFWYDPLPYAGLAPAAVIAGISNQSSSIGELMERPSEVTVFKKGSTQSVVMWALLRGINGNENIAFRYYRPNGALAHSYSNTTYGFKTGWQQYAYSLPGNAALGTWSAAIEVNGVELARKAFDVTTVGAPEVRVDANNGTYIVDGRTTPIAFASVPVGSPPPTMVFTVTNHGTAPLTTTGLVVPAGFEVVEGLAASIAAGASDTFTVRRPSTATGYATGYVQFSTNDASEGTFNFAIEGTITGAPTATIYAPDLSFPEPNAVYTITVTYTDDVAVNVASLDSNDIKVTGPMGVNVPVTFLSVDNPTNGPTRTATYRVNAPGGTWDATDWGPYVVTLQANQVRDTSSNAALPKQLDEFQAWTSLVSFSAQGVLTVWGMYTPDTIRVYEESGNFYVAINAWAPYYWPTSWVKKVIIKGLGGNDTLTAEAGFNKPVTLDGGTGNDSLFGGSGADVLIGGPGNDVLSGGAGKDTADYGYETAPVNLSIDGIANDGRAGEQDNISLDIENLVGGSGNDTLTGSSGANKLTGGTGNDLLLGGAGNDVLDGGLGNDTCTGGAGADQLIFRGSANADALDLVLMMPGVIRARRSKRATPAMIEEEDTWNIDASDKISVIGGNGDDLIQVGATITLAGTVDGGAGVDTCVAPAAVTRKNCEL